MKAPVTFPEQSGSSTIPRNIHVVLPVKEQPSNGELTVVTAPSLLGRACIGAIEAERNKDSNAARAAEQLAVDAARIMLTNPNGPHFTDVLLAFDDAGASILPEVA